MIRLPIWLAIPLCGLVGWAVLFGLAYLVARFHLLQTVMVFLLATVGLLIMGGLVAMILDELDIIDIR